VSGAATLPKTAHVTAGSGRRSSFRRGPPSCRFTVQQVSLGRQPGQRAGPSRPPCSAPVALARRAGPGPVAHDSFLNLQADGHVFFGPGVSVSARGQLRATISLAGPFTVELDLTGIAPRNAGNALPSTCSGFALWTPTSSSTTLQLAGDLAPVLSFQLDPVSDSGVAGDGITNWRPSP